MRAPRHAPVVTRGPTGAGKRPTDAAVVWLAAPLGGWTGCGAAWLACCVRDAEVPGSNPGSPTPKVPGQGGGDGGPSKLLEQLARQRREQSLVPRVATTISHWENDLRVRSCTATTASDSPGVRHTARAERHPSKRSASSRRFVGVGGAARTIRAPAAGSRMVRLRATARRPTYTRPVTPATPVVSLFPERQPSPPTPFDSWVHRQKLRRAAFHISQIQAACEAGRRGMASESSLSPMVKAANSFK